MALNDRQLKILKVIDEGNITGENIVKALSSSMQMLSYYLNTLADDGYLKVARVYDNETRDFIIVRAYLTDQGKAALTPLPQNEREADAPPIDAPAETHPSGPIDYTRLAQAIAQISHETQKLPEPQRKLVEVYLEDLQNEVNVSYRRKTPRIRAYFFAILSVVLPGLNPENQTLRSPLETIAAQLKLNIPLQLPSESKFLG